MEWPRIDWNQIFSDDSTWYIPPLGYFMSIVFFPSYWLGKYYTTSQETALIDFKQALETRDHSRLKKLVIQLQLMNFKFRYLNKLLNEIKSNEISPVDEKLVSSIISNKTTFSEAIGRELYLRNPIKYEKEHPWATFLGKLTFGSLSALLLMNKFLPTVKKLNHTIKSKTLSEFIHHSGVAIKTGGQTAFHMIHLRWKILLFASRHPRIIFGTFVGMNLLHLAYWTKDSPA